MLALLTMEKRSDKRMLRDNRNSVAYRIAISVAALWFLGTSAYYLFSDDPKWQFASRYADAQCAGEDEESLYIGAPSAKMMCKTDWSDGPSSEDAWKEARPWLFIRDAVLPGVFFVGAALYGAVLWAFIRAGGKIIFQTTFAIASRYLRWVRHG